MNNFANQHLDSIRIQPNVTLLVEYSEPDQGGTRLLHRFYISQNREIDIESGYINDAKFQKKRIPLKDVPQQVCDDVLGWIDQQLQCRPADGLIKALNGFKELLG